MNLTEISFDRLKQEIELYLRNTFSSASLLFSPSSPYGQILLVVQNLYQMSLLYLKNSIKQFDLSENNSLNSRVIRNAAIFAGHIPGRNISSTGTLKLTIKTSTDIERSIPGRRVTLFNKQAMINKTNGLEYSIQLGTDKQTYNITNNTQILIPIIQGKWERRVFTGTNTQNQTFQIILRGNNKDVENFNYEVIVNGEVWSVKKHIYDMLPDEKACVIRTGFNGGIDLIFGNGGFGMMPPLASVIEVNYLVSDGSLGSIFRRTQNDWNFIVPAIDGNGNTLDISNLFDISIYTDINFGADKETLQFTKNILPIASNNFVLGLPQQYAYQIKRLGVFSHVNAYEKLGVVYIMATPNIKLFKSRNSNYFTIDIKAFELDNYEKSKISKYLKTGGNIQLTKRFRIESPKLSYYIMNVFIITYSDSIDTSVNAQVYDVISEYFLNFTRINRVPKSDLVSLLSQIQEIHSVDISFVAKKNEDYHRQYKLIDENRRNQYASQTALQIQAPNPQYDPNKTLGLDPVLGDILFEADEIPIIRGGWYDRNNIYFSNNIEDNTLKSVNIIKKGTVDVSNKQQF